MMANHAPVCILVLSLLGVTLSCSTSAPTPLSALTELPAATLPPNQEIVVDTPTLETRSPMATSTDPPEIISTADIPSDTPEISSTAAVPTSTSEAMTGELSEFDAYVEVEASQADLQVGDAVTITGKPVGIGQPYYSLVMRDEGVQENPYTVTVTYNNLVTAGEGRSQVLEFVSVEASMDQVTFVLRAIASGVTSVDIEASGEVHYPDGSATWMGYGSGTVLIIVGD